MRLVDQNMFSERTGKDRRPYSTCSASTDFRCRSLHSHSFGEDLDAWIVAACIVMEDLNDAQDLGMEWVAQIPLLDLLEYLHEAIRIFIIFSAIVDCHA